MKDLALDEKGDVLIENGEINLVVGDSLLRQKVMTILRTNLKEWFFDWDQGVDFDNLLGKGVGDELARYEIERGLHQVDNSFTITEFSYTPDKSTRKAKVTFKAQIDNGEEIGGDIAWD
jgi:hypothetical protein